MKVLNSRNIIFPGLLILVIAVMAGIYLHPQGVVLADSNVPTITPSPEPTVTNTPVPETPTQTPPTQTPDPYPGDDQNGFLLATAVPRPPENATSSLSLINRLLLVCLSVVTVLVIGMIVYLVFNQTRGGGGLGNRF